ncbi:RNA polymerase sigma factor [Anaerosporobacter sp.]
MKNTMSTQEFETMYHKYKGLLYRISFTYMKNQEDTEDILQEVFTKRLYVAPEFNTEEHERRWLIRITINLSKNHLKSFWNRNRNSLEECEIEIPWQMDSRKKEVWEEVVLLPDKCRVAMYLFYYEGYSCKEIGKMLGCTESAVKMRLKKGREKLKINLLKGGTFYET